MIILCFAMVLFNLAVAVHLAVGQARLVQRSPLFKMLCKHRQSKKKVMIILRTIIVRRFLALYGKQKQCRLSLNERDPDQKRKIKSSEKMDEVRDEEKGDSRSREDDLDHASEGIHLS